MGGKERRRHLCSCAWQSRLLWHIRCATLARQERWQQWLVKSRQKERQIKHFAWNLRENGVYWPTKAAYSRIAMTLQGLRSGQHKFLKNSVEFVTVHTHIHARRIYYVSSTKEGRKQHPANIMRVDEFIIEDIVSLLKQSATEGSKRNGMRADGRSIPSSLTSKAPAQHWRKLTESLKRALSCVFSVHNLIFENFE